MLSSASSMSSHSNRFAATAGANDVQQQQQQLHRNQKQQHVESRVSRLFKCLTKVEQVRTSPDANKEHLNNRIKSSFDQIRNKLDMLEQSLHDQVDFQPLQSQLAQPIGSVERDINQLIESLYSVSVTNTTPDYLETTLKSVDFALQTLDENIASLDKFVALELDQSVSDLNDFMNYRIERLARFMNEENANIANLSRMLLKQKQHRQQQQQQQQQQRQQSDVSGLIDKLQTFVNYEFNDWRYQDKQTNTSSTPEVIIRSDDVAFENVNKTGDPNLEVVDSFELINLNKELESIDELIVDLEGDDLADCAPTVPTKRGSFSNASCSVDKKSVLRYPLQATSGSQMRSDILHT